MKYKSNYIFIQYLHNIFPLPVLFLLLILLNLLNGSLSLCNNNALLIFPNLSIWYCCLFPNGAKPEQMSRDSKVSHLKDLFSNSAKRFIETVTCGRCCMEL